MRDMGKQITNQPIKTTMKTTPNLKSFFHRYRISWKFTSDTFHSCAGQFTFTLPRSRVSVHSEGREIFTKPLIAPFLFTAVAEKIFFNDSSVYDFEFSPTVFKYASDKDLLLRDLLFTGHVHLSFSFVNVDRGCDCVSSGVVTFKLYDKGVCNV